MSLGKAFKEETLRKTFAKVFDRQSIQAIHALPSKGSLNLVEFVISTGKEAHVFRAVDKAGNFLAVKVYKVSTSNFHNMQPYLQGDYRFKQVRKEKRDIVHAWARKEYRNLRDSVRAGVKAPVPIAVKENVLVMEFIGSEGVASPRLKDVKSFNAESVYRQVVENLARLTFTARLVHADLSEFNMLLQDNEKAWFIDFGQGLPLTHPKAQEFFTRDVRNLAGYFRKQGLRVSEESMRADIRDWKEKLA